MIHLTQFFTEIKIPQTYQLYHITRWANKWVERADIWITAEIGNQDFLLLKISLLTSIIIIEFYRPPGPPCCAIGFWLFDHNFVIKYPVVCILIRNAQNHNRIDKPYSLNTIVMPCYLGWSWGNIHSSCVGWLEGTRMSTQPICCLY